MKDTVRFKDKGKGTALDVLEGSHSQQSMLSRWEKMTERMNEHCQYTP